MTSHKVLLFCLISGIITTNFLEGTADPCDENNHRTFPEVRLGSRNEICGTGPDLQLCDYYLTDDWYIGQKFKLINHCPQNGSCGVAYPAWMNGTFPNIEDDVVYRNVCIQEYNNCCADNVEIKIKNCSSFFVYYLVHLPECSNAYCFASNYSCDEPTTTTTATTTITTTIITTTTVAPSSSADGQAKDYVKYIIIGISIVVGIAACGAAIGIAITKTAGLQRSGKVSSGITVEANISDRPPPYDHVINTDTEKQRIVESLANNISS